MTWPDPADIAEYDQLIAKGSDQLDGVVARVRLALSTRPEHSVVAALNHELVADTDQAIALATIAVLRRAKEA